MKRQYRLFGFIGPNEQRSGTPVFGILVFGESPEEAVEYIIDNVRDARQIKYWTVYSNNTTIKIVKESELIRI